MSKINDVLKEYLSVKDICQKYNLSRHAAAYLVRTRNENGLSAIIFPIGRKFYIHKQDFERWASEYYGDGHAK